MAIAPSIESMTAEELGNRPDPGYPEELVRGRIIRIPPPDRMHGYVCVEMDFLLRMFVGEHDLGRVMGNDSAVITERGPDTARSANICFYSYSILPKGSVARGYGPEVPELIVEVRSPSNAGETSRRRSRNTSMPASSPSWCSIPKG